MCYMARHALSKLTEHADDKHGFMFQEPGLADISVRTLKYIVSECRRMNPDTRCEVVEGVDGFEIHLSPDPRPETLVGRINDRLVSFGLRIESIERIPAGGVNYTLPAELYGEANEANRAKVQRVVVDYFGLARLKKSPSS